MTVEVLAGGDMMPPHYEASLVYITGGTGITENFG